MLFALIIGLLQLINIGTRANNDNCKHGATGTELCTVSMAQLMSEMEEYTHLRFDHHQSVQFIEYEMGDSIIFRQRAMVYWQVVAWLFADLNNVALRYEVADTEGKKLLNRHMKEDGSHYKLFQHDWDALGLNDHPMTADRAIEFFFSEPLASSRKSLYNVIAIDGRLNGKENEFARYVVIESIELVGEIFFGSLNKHHQYDAFYNRTGIELVYFGAFHIPLENGGLMAEPYGDECDQEVLLEADIFKSHQMSQQEYDLYLSAAREIVDDK